MLPCPRTLFVMSLLVGLTVLSAAAQTTSVWDGVYTDAQAARGREQYIEICGYCHRDDLTGGGSEAGAPALAGPLFVSQWEARSVSELFIKIGTTMPQQNPDSLRAQVVIDIVGFLLQANGMPTGDEELPPALGPLDEIIITEQPAE